MSLVRPVNNRAPMAMLMAVLILTSVVLLFLGGNAFRVYVDGKETISQVVRLEELRGTILHLDEVLTMSARMATSTGDISWESRYLQFEPALDSAIKEAVTLVGDPRQKTTHDRSHDTKSQRISWGSIGRWPVMKPVCRAPMVWPKMPVL